MHGHTLLQGCSSSPPLLAQMKWNRMLGAQLWGSYKKQQQFNAVHSLWRLKNVFILFPIWSFEINALSFLPKQKPDAPHTRETEDDELHVTLCTSSVLSVLCWGFLLEGRRGRSSFFFQNDSDERRGIFRRRHTTYVKAFAQERSHCHNFWSVNSLWKSNGCVSIIWHSESLLQKHP